MRVCLDLEANALLPEVNHIWCVCVTELDSGVCHTYLEGDKERFLLDSLRWTVLVGHGILTYDLWVLWKVWKLPFTVGPDTFSGRSVEFVDTLVLSRYLNPDRGGHGLEWWGEKLDYKKGDHTDWGQYSEEMRDYCERDTRLGIKVYEAVERELA